MFLHLGRRARNFADNIKKLFFSDINWHKTIMFNFRMLPFKKALFLPIVLYGKIDIRQCTGCIELQSEKLSFGQWKIGQNFCFVNGMYTCYNYTYMAIAGLLKLGDKGRISNGCHISVQENAVLSLGDDFYISANARVGCYEEIMIGNRTRISWNTQIYDTDFHYVLLDNGMVRRRNKPVKIGNSVWIGHDVTINKGTNIGDWCIVSSLSLLNKNYGINHALIAGIPATIKKEGVMRIFGDAEYELNAYFCNNPNSKDYYLQEYEDFVF